MHIKGLGKSQLWIQISQERIAVWSKFFFVFQNEHTKIHDRKIILTFHDIFDKLLILTV